MNDIEKLLKRIERMTAPIRELERTVNKIVPPYINQLNQSILPVVQQHERMCKVFQPMLDQINRISKTYRHAAKAWQNSVRHDLILMAESGWYPNWFTFDFKPKSEDVSIDELMEEHITQDWDRVTNRILEQYPNRAHILSVAFKLHAEKNYIAAIPLFLAQADGVCCEAFKSFLFAENTVAEKIEELVHDGKIEPNIFADVFLEPFSLKNHHNAGMSKASAAAKAKAPNRNGILHGYRKHLDYGTRRNSLKTISLLSFVVFVSTEFVKHNTALQPTSGRDAACPG